MEYTEIGERMKRRRMELNVSAAALAERLSLSKATIHRYENGDVKNIKMPVVEAMAKELKVDALWLLGRSEVKEKKKGARYMSVESIFDDLLYHLRATEGLLYGNKPLSNEDRHIIVSSLEVLRKLMDFKNR